MANVIEPDVTVGVTAHTIDDIHRAYFSTLAATVDNDLRSAEVILDHEEGPNVVRGFHEQLRHEAFTSRRFSGGGSYYHTASDTDGVATRCINITETVPDGSRRSLSQQRRRFGNTIVEKLEEQTRLSNEDLIYDFNADPDIYVQDKDNGVKQVVGASMRYFPLNRAEPGITDDGAYLYRACVQRRGVFKDSVDDSQWLLERDNVDPETYKENVRAVPKPFAQPNSYQDISSLQGPYHSVDALAWAAKGQPTGGVKPRFLAHSPVRRGTNEPLSGKPPEPCVPVETQSTTPYETYE